jgi:hypothetical protein
MMPLFSILESFFFLCLAISFVLILLMVHHFKKRLDAMEKSNQTIADICKSLIGEIEQVKTLAHNPAAASSTPLPPSHSSSSFSSSPPQMPKDGEFIFTSSAPMGMPMDIGMMGRNIPPEYIHDFTETLFRKILVTDDVLQDTPEEPSEPLNITEYDTEELDDVESCSTNESNTEDDLEPMEEVYAVSNVPLDEIDGSEIILKIDSEFPQDSRVEELVSDSSEPNLDRSSSDTIEISPIDTMTAATTVALELELDPSSSSSQAESKDIIQVTKLNETDPLEETMSEMSETENEKHNRSSLQKMNVQMLRAIVIREGLCTDPAKIKKPELIQMILGE